MIPTPLWEPWVPEQFIEWIVCSCGKRYRTVVGFRNHSDGHGYSPYHQARQILTGQSHHRSGSYR